jgi:indole-3-glycerol phosphate synthase
VNQRDLATFEVDPTRAAQLAGSFPSDVVTVAESGIRTSDDAHQLGGLGYDAILVGEAFVLAEDPAAAVASFWDDDEQPGEPPDAAHGAEGVVTATAVAAGGTTTVRSTT